MTSHRNQHEPSLAASLRQYSTSESSSRDIILLMPIMQLPQKSGNTCLCLVHLDNTCLGVCNAPTEERCPGCGCFVCEDHQSPFGMPLTNEAGEEHPVLLCDVCAFLPIQKVYALRAFRLSINSSEGQGLVKHLDHVIQQKGLRLAPSGCNEPPHREEPNS